MSVGSRFIVEGVTQCCLEVSTVFVFQPTPVIGRGLGDALRVLLNKIYDAETGALCEISNEEAAQTLKLMSEKLD